MIKMVPRVAVSSRSRSTHCSEPFGQFANFLGHMIGPEISGFLEAPGDWLLCWVEVPNISNNRISLLCAKTADEDVTYVRIRQRTNGQFRGAIMVGMESNLPPSSSTTEEELEAKELKVKKDASSLKALIFHFETHGLSNGARLIRPVSRPDWLLPHGLLYRNVHALIGIGNFGRVIRGALTVPPDLPVLVAVKVISEGKELNERMETRRKIVREAQIQTMFHDPNIVKCFGICTDHRRMALVLDLCVGGALDEHVQKNCDRVSPNEFLFYLVDILKGLKHIHSQQCIHRDVALRNCLISSRGVIKLSDFGLSCSVEELDRHEKDSIVGNVPIRWMAPETLHRTSVFSFASDVWAFGMVVYEIFHFGNEPWPTTNARQIRSYICSGSMPTLTDRMSADVKRVVRRCWERDATKRPTIEELLLEFRHLVKAQDRNFPAVSANDLSVFKLDGVQAEKFSTPSSFSPLPAAKSNKRGGTI